VTVDNDCKDDDSDINVDGFGHTVSQYIVADDQATVHVSGETPS
jgi:hypothetical protein